jgi:hypothetical protein
MAWKTFPSPQSKIKPEFVTCVLYASDIYVGITFLPCRKLMYLQTIIHYKIGSHPGNTTTTTTTEISLFVEESLSALQ